MGPAVDDHFGRNMQGSQLTTLLHSTSSMSPAAIQPADFQNIILKQPGSKEFQQKSFGIDQRLFIALSAPGNIGELSPLPDG